MRAKNPPAFTATIAGPWGVDCIGNHWYVVHSETLRAKKIGRCGARKTNYFDVAIDEASKRNAAKR